MGYEEQKIEGRNAVLEAFRSGKTIDKLFVLDGCQDGPVRTIVLFSIFTVIPFPKGYLLNSYLTIYFL